MVEWQMNHAQFDSWGKGTHCRMADFSTDSGGKPDEKKELSDTPISRSTQSLSSACKHTVDMMFYIYTVKVSACELE